MRTSPLDILYEDNHLLAINKPAGLPTMGVSADKTSLVQLAKQYLKSRYLKPGNVYLGVVSRLDGPTSGVVLLARTSKAAARLAEQFRTRAVQKVYWALVEGTPQPPSGEWTDWVVKEERLQRMVIARGKSAGAKQARLTYRKIATTQGKTLLEIEPETGRKHQIRLQLSHRGLPVLGDRKYCSHASFPVGIALHARRLVVKHPTLGTVIELVAPLPASWGQWKAESGKRKADS